jgi:ubiquinone/menaquinone biosynthesis C-methylase UbiE
MDVYLLDQIMKGRYAPSDLILDAGAGGGRNLHWFVQEGFQVYGTDRNPESVEVLKQTYPYLPNDRFQVATVESLPFPDAFFNHIISSAVLHFAENEQHFEAMFSEMVRVLRPGGSIFIRMTTDVGMGNKMTALGQGRYYLSDDSERFLLTRKGLDSLLLQYRLALLEPFKTVLVEDLRSMGVVVLGKIG